MNLNSINSFIDNSDSYLLKVNNSQGTESLEVLKKNLWTWLKIHVGSRLGLFDKNTIQIDTVARYILAHKEEIDEKLVQIVDVKIHKWNGKHSHHINPISTKSYAYTVRNDGNFSKWISLKNGEISDKIIAKLPKNFFKDVKSSISENGRNEAVDVDAPAGKIRTVTLNPTIYNCSPSFVTPDLNKISQYLNGEIDDGQEELEKLARMQLPVSLTFYRDADNNMHSQIVING
jgi:hypothetical protein